MKALFLSILALLPAAASAQRDTLGVLERSSVFSAEDERAVAGFHTESPAMMLYRSEQSLSQISLRIDLRREQEALLQPLGESKELPCGNRAHEKPVLARERSVPAVEVQGGDRGNVEGIAEEVAAGLGTVEAQRKAFVRRTRLPVAVGTSTGRSCSSEAESSSVPVTARK